MFLGSANEPRTLRNPFSFEERKEMLQKIFPAELVLIKPLEDILYNDVVWVESIQAKVNKTILENMNGNSKKVTIHGLNDIKVALIGHSKDNSNYYLKLFPQWDSINVDSYSNISSSELRKVIFGEITEDLYNY